MTSLKVGVLALVIVFNSLIFVIEMYREMGSVFLGTCVRRVVTIGDTAGYSLPFNREEVNRRIGYFMDARDKSERKDILFSDNGSTNKLWVQACKSLTLKETFAPPCGVLADAATTLGTKPVQKNAGFEYGETDESYTLWIVSGPRESVDLHHEYVPYLFHTHLLTSTKHCGGTLSRLAQDLRAL